MRKIAITVLAGALASIALVVPASASDAHPICVQDYDGSWFSIITTDSPEDAAYIAGRTVKPFPYEQGLGGCSAYTFGYGEKVCAANVAEVTARAEELTHEVNRQNVVISRLRAKIERLKNRR